MMLTGAMTWRSITPMVVQSPVRTTNASVSSGILLTLHLPSVPQPGMLERHSMCTTPVMMAAYVRVGCPT